MKVPKNGKERIVYKGLNVRALRHTAITLANTAPNSNVINTALMAGHTAIRTENIYTHANINALKNIKTVNISNKTEKSENSIDNEGIDKELYDMYIKLKEKFEGNLK